MAEIDNGLKADIAIGIFRKGLLLLGDFTLRSGAWSPYYLDLRPAPSISVDETHPTMSRKDQLKFRKDVIQGYSTVLDSVGDYEHIQAIPEAAVALTAMIGFARDDSVLYRRVQAKDHGKGTDGILGNYLPGDRTVLVDDLISTSGAKVDEKRLVEDISVKSDDNGNIGGLVVSHAVILLDRQTGGKEAAAEAGLQVHEVVTLSEVLATNRAEGLLDERSWQIIEGYTNGTIQSPDDLKDL